MRNLLTTGANRMTITAAKILHFSPRRGDLPDAFRQSIMADHDRVPFMVLAKAIAAAETAYKHGLDFVGVFEAASEVVADYATGLNDARAVVLHERNRGRLQRWRARAFQYRLSRVHDHVRARMCGMSDLSVHYAMVRARRVLEGGGTVPAAIYHALGYGGDDFEVVG